jgi:hypothetical protein
LQPHEYGLVIMDPPPRPSVRIQRFGWFDQRFDHMYQAPTDAVQVPLAYYGSISQDRTLCAVAVQRSSKIYLYTPEDDRLHREVALADRHGSRAPMFRTTATQAWLKDL